MSIRAIIARPLARLGGSCLALASLAGMAAAQLGPGQVLLVYDSRSSDSKLVAEHYAGSARVPGGIGGIKGKYPVTVLDLASTGVPLSPVGNITYANFVSNIRTPIRSYLTANALQKRIRVIVTTKGMPHRIQDTDLPNAGDNPNDQANELNASDATCASVDSELTLLYQNLNTGENGNAGDSKSDGCVANPFWKSTLPLAAYPTTNIIAQKTFSRPTGFPAGILWTIAGSGASKLTAGDIYLVSRLDGKTVADVKAMIDRGGNIVINTNTASMVFDEANSTIASNGVADATSDNGEWDNDSLSAGILWAGDDFEKTRDLVQADGRYLPAKIRYNAASGVSNFIVGPLINYQGQGILVSDPVIFLSSWGSNCGAQATQPQTAAGVNAGQNYTKSFNLARGACFTSVESYNARDFGGYGSWFGGWGPQAQISDFIEAGGTFAVGNCWEPFTFGLPDNEWIVRNFYLGNMTWVEAAWSAIPCLSWQTIVVGDPLATVQRTCEDVNNDGKVDIEDVIRWEQNPTDINRDGLANATDKLMIETSARWTENSFIRDR
jgi:hypothetical protein